VLEASSVNSTLRCHHNSVHPSVTVIAMLKRVNIKSHPHQLLNNSVKVTRMGTTDTCGIKNFDIFVQCLTVCWKLYKIRTTDNDSLTLYVILVISNCLIYNILENIHVT